MRPLGATSPPGRATTTVRPTATGRGRRAPQVGVL